MSSDSPPVVKRAIGRPRDPALEGRIRDAGLAVLAEHGFSGLTLDRVCAAARIPKATFYRRWSNPRVLVSEAFNERYEHGLLHDTGDLAADLRTFARVLMGLYTDPILGRCLLFILAEGTVHRELVPLFAVAQGERRRHNLATLERALEAQGFDPAVTAGEILDVLNGVIVNGYASGRRTTPETLDTLVDVLLRPREGAPAPPS